MEVQGPRDWRPVAGWCLAALTMVLLCSVPLSLAGGVLDRPGVRGDAPDFWIVPIVGGFALSGALLVTARPRNSIGWLLLCSGLLQVLNVSLDAYAARALTDPDGSLPLGLPATWVASFAWFPSLLLPVVVLPALYPTGRPPSRFWRWHVRAALAGIGLAVLAVATGPGGVDDTVSGTTLPWEAPTPWVLATGLLAGALLIGTAAVTLIGTVVRVIRADAPERQQLLLLLVVVTVMAGTVFTGYDVLFVLAYTLVPVAVAVGVLRYRLLGIEIVLRRTLLYVPLTLLVAVVIAGLTTALTRVAPAGPLPLLAASAVVAVGLVPAAGWIRRAVDRVVLGERADPLSAVDRVGAGLELEHDDPVAAMLEAIVAATDARFGAVSDPEGRAIATVGDPAPPVTEVALRHDGASFGTLSVGLPMDSTASTRRHTRLLAALAPQLAVVVRAQLLTRQLAAERQRVAAATLVERDRLRRDLHDGLGPSLSGIALGLEAAESAIGSDPELVPPLLERLRLEASQAVREVRRVIDALRPSMLDGHDLVGAVRDTATTLGLGRPGGPHFELDAEGLPALRQDVEEAAFRIVAESLTNVVRHAEADHCTVVVKQVDDGLRLEVCDDGRGVRREPGAGPGAGEGAGRDSGHGIASMRRRASDLGGALSVRRGQPSGTTVTVDLPLAGAR